jgi:6-pyruvoyltetrahydropterin/6-carboxytetrahydropterin synthase
MSYQITTRIEFCYAHRITRHNGKCFNLHGHNGLLELAIQAETLDDCGMVQDFAHARQIAKQWVDHHLDHATILANFDELVSVIRFHNQKIYVMSNEPTAENMLVEIYRGLSGQGLQLQHLQLWETANNSAAYFL